MCQHTFSLHPKISTKLGTLLLAIMFAIPIQLSTFNYATDDRMPMWGNGMSIDWWYNRMSVDWNTIKNTDIWGCTILLTIW